MPHLFADADPPWFRPPEWVAYVAATLIVGAFVWDRFGGSLKAWRASRAEAKVVEAKADSDAAEAELKPVGAYARIVARLDKRLAAYDAKSDAQEEKIDRLERQHEDCERRFNDLTRTCDVQQRELDAGRATTADLTAKVTRLASLLRGFGVNDTGEHTPLPDSPPKG